MRIKRIAFEKYKAFDQRQEIELKPLTVFLGRNASGKSAVIRLIPLLIQSFGDKNGTLLNWGMEELFPNNTLLDFVAERKLNTIIKFEVELEFEQSLTEIALDVFVYFDMQTNEVAAQLVKLEIKSARFGSIAFTSEEKSEIYELNVKPLNQSILKHRATQEQLVLQGIFPKMNGWEKQINSEWKNYLEQLFLVAGDLKNNTRFIGPNREAGRPIFEYQTRENKSMFWSVQDYAKWYIDNKGTSGNIVDAFYGSKELGTWSLKTQRGLSNHFQIDLSRTRQEAPLTQAGSGMAQIFPVVVQRAINQLTKDKIELVEEPETHLHPSAHGEIADLFIKGIELDHQMIIETHSEIFILRLRRRVAEGLDPSAIALYLIDESDKGSQIKRLEIQKNGKVLGWPDYLFSEDYEEILAIDEALERQSNDG